MAQQNPATQLVLAAVAAHGAQTAGAPVGVPVPVAAGAAGALLGAHTQFDVEAGLSKSMPTKSNKGCHIHAIIT